jgi:hypothetical protein
MMRGGQVRNSSLRVERPLVVVSEVRCDCGLNGSTTGRREDEPTRPGASGRGREVRPAGNDRFVLCRTRVFVLADPVEHRVRRRLRAC